MIIAARVLVRELDPLIAIPTGPGPVAYKTVLRAEAPLAIRIPERIKINFYLLCNM